MCFAGPDVIFKVNNDDEFKIKKIDLNSNKVKPVKISGINADDEITCIKVANFN
jgi:hypothetical protein